MRPWLLSLSPQLPHIHLTRQRRGLLFNTRYLSPATPRLHVPARLTATKPTQKRLDQTGISSMMASCQGPVLSQQIVHILQPKPQTGVSKKDKHAWMMDYRAEIQLDQGTEKKSLKNGYRFFFFFLLFIYRRFVRLA